MLLNAVVAIRSQPSHIHLSDLKTENYMLLTMPLLIISLSNWVKLVFLFLNLKSSYVGEFSNGSVFWGRFSESLCSLPEAGLSCCYLRVCATYLTRKLLLGHLLPHRGCYRPESLLAAEIKQGTEPGGEGRASCQVHFIRFLSRKHTLLNIFSLGEERYYLKACLTWKQTLAGLELTV